MSTKEIQARALLSARHYCAQGMGMARLQLDNHKWRALTWSATGDRQRAAYALRVALYISRLIRQGAADHAR